MEKLILTPIGTIRCHEDGSKIVLRKQYAPALVGLEGFSHIQVVWWFSQSDDGHSRDLLSEQSPYKYSPSVLGIFATRSPRRPNPIGLTCAEISYIDPENAQIGLTYIDAFDNTPVLDIKPYTPSLDRVAQPQVPLWCRHWPQSYESSAEFDWEGEMNS